ncbi:hypothetical protein [Nocardia vinacea]|uniref:hypothetical protein n=1 Tax=Nocardia vinacea TaxID=96468 RepID=UPI0002DA9D1B|nr:hypothetical protein [Nocardia vinacea]
MITPIEIKVNLDGDVAAALTRLECTGRPAIDRRIWFAEPRPTGLHTAPTLLSSRIVIRLRSGENDDLTVKLRPCLPSQLVGRWTTSFTDDALRYRIEEDWNAERRVLSASAVSDRPAGSLHDATMLGADVTTVLDTAQRQLLVSCTPPGVAVDRLVAMGPIASTKWTKVRVGDLHVDAERWTIADLDLLELSLRITPEHGESHTEVRNRALRRQRKFEAAVRRRGLHIATGDTKTQQVLAALTARSIRR